MLGLFYQKNKILVVTLAIVSAMLLIAVVIRPIIVGFTTYQKVKSYNYSLEDYGKDVQELKNKLLVSSTNLSACTDLNNKFSEQLDRYLGRYSECAGQLKALETNFSLTQEVYETLLASLRKDIKEKEEDNQRMIEEKNKEISKIQSDKDSEISSLKLQYDTLAQNAANNICCKAKVDNPRIRYYQVESNRIMCLEEGTKAISC